MDKGSDLPDSIMDAVRVIRDLHAKPSLLRTEQENLNRAKLRVAFWACRTENIIASRENLTYVLGPDARDIMGAYDKYLQREDEKPADSGRPAARRDGGRFWDGA